MEDVTGITTYNYDAINQLIAVTCPGNKTISYSYDAVGNRASMTDPDDGVTTYIYDARNLLSLLINPYGEITTWQYDVLGRVTTMTYANGTLAEYDYDAAGQLIALRNLKSDRYVISIFTYSYDAVGRRTQVEEANGDVVSWSYDELGQLTHEWRSGVNGYDVTYTYDEVGNRLAKEDGAVIITYTYDAANQLQTVYDGSGISTYSYDANGNTILEQRPNDDRVTYSWNCENQLVKTELPVGVINTYSLDGDGKRYSIEDSAGLRKLIWDVHNLLAELDGDGVTLANYIIAPQQYGHLISQRRGANSSFHHFDALGSTNKLTDSDATERVEYLYRAFGEQSTINGTSTNPFTWMGKLGYYRQADTSDYYVRARILTPLMGRWLSRDPLQSTMNQRSLTSLMNLYNYAYNMPFLFADPSGLEVDDCCPTVSCYSTYVECTKAVGQDWLECAQDCVPSIWRDEVIVTVSCIIFGVVTCGAGGVACEIITNVIGGIGTRRCLESCDEIIDEERSTCDFAYCNCLHEDARYCAQQVYDICW